MARLKRLGVSCLVFALSSSGCGNSQSASGVLDFALNSNSDANFAILAGNDGGDLPGVPVDIQNWRRFINEGKLGRFNIVYDRDRDASSAGVRDAFASIVPRLKPDSTVLFVYSGHGDEMGVLKLNGPATFKQLTEPLLKVPTEGARFFFFNDSCFSGKSTSAEGSASASREGALVSKNTARTLPQINDGFKGQDFTGGLGGGQSIDNQPNLNSLFGTLFGGDSGNGTLTLTDEGTVIYPQNQRLNTDVLVRGASELAGPASPFGQLFVVASASETQMAKDLGSSGGLFTATFMQAIEHYYNQWSANKVRENNPSIERVLNAVLSATTGQAPEYRYFPAGVETDTLFPKEVKTSAP